MSEMVFGRMCPDCGCEYGSPQCCINKQPRQQMIKIKAATDEQVAKIKQSANDWKILARRTILSLIARIEEDKKKTVSQTLEIDRLESIYNNLQQNYLNEALKLSKSRKEVDKLRSVANDAISMLSDISEVLKKHSIISAANTLDDIINILTIAAKEHEQDER